MGFDVSVYLPPHAGNQKITLVIQKILGVDFIIHNEDGLLKQNPSPIEIKITPFDFIDDLSFLNLEVYDKLKNKYHFYIHTDLQATKDHISIENYTKMLSCESKGIELGIAKRLVDFFGGKITLTRDIGYKEELTKEDKKFNPDTGIYYVKNGKFSNQKISMKKFNENEQYENFGKLLLNEELLSFESIDLFLNTKRFIVDFSEEQEKSLFFIHKDNLKNTIEKKLTEKPLVLNNQFKV